MSVWQRRTIREIVVGLFDGPHATPPVAAQGPVFLGIANVTEEGHLDLSQVRHIAEADYGRWTRRVTPTVGDIVFTYEATLNRYAIIPDGFRGCLGRRMALIRPDTERVDTRFLFYSFFSKAWRDTIEANRLSGATVDRIPIAKFPSFPIDLPSLQEQRRIGSILGAYDDLIEANRRRIALLERMRRELFDEWFVRWRFPGHDNQNISAGASNRLPEEWAWANLEDLCERGSGIQTGPFGSQLHQEDYAHEGVPVVMPKNIVGLRIIEDGIARIPPHIAASLSRHILQDGDIAYGRRGDIGRRAYVSTRENGWFCGTGCLRLRPNRDRAVPRYLFDALGLPITEGAIKGRAQGAIMPNLSVGVMKTIPVLAPPLLLQQRYSDLITPMTELSASLVAANVQLAESRDLLLPRLTSGEITLASATRDLEAAA